MCVVPSRLKWLENSSQGREWLRNLPARVKSCADRWSLKIGSPYPHANVSAVFSVATKDGCLAVLKVQFPHRECEHEAEALRLWNGRGAVRLLARDREHHAYLMERCEPGDHLSTVVADEALDVFADLLPRLWISVTGPFVALHEEAKTWARDLPVSWERAHRPFEKALLDAALEALYVLPETQGEQVLVHQDLHGDNVLRASREPWLAIDPKPLVGEREFSLAPIIRSYEFGHSRKDVIHRLDKLSSALDVNRERARLWTLTQALAWCFEGDRMLERHVETARWLWQA